MNETEGSNKGKQTIRTKRAFPGSRERSVLVRV